LRLPSPGRPGDQAPDHTPDADPAAIARFRREDSALSVRAEAAFRGRLPAFPEVRAWVEAFAAAQGADRTATLRLVLVLEELFTNTVAHGYAAGAEGPIWITLARGAAVIEVTYEDAGPPFDPIAGPQPARIDPRPPGEPGGGLGLALVRGLSTAARYARVGERNRVTLGVPMGEAPPATAG
jgi:serine/threonine-protein kinase RsbW